MGEFAAWLLEQAGRGDLVGKLAGDTLRKIKEPDHLVPLDSDIKKDWRDYVSGLGNPVIETLTYAWKEWAEAEKKIQSRNKGARQRKVSFTQEDRQKQLIIAL